MSHSVSNKKKEIEVCFTTDLPDEFHLTQTNYNLPLEFSKAKLNEFIQKMLRTKQNFSFLIKDIMIDATLEDFLMKNFITTEKVVEVYYMLEVPQPEKSNTIKEDEWIKSIQLINLQKYSANETEYAVGLFNGQISFYNKSNEKLMTLGKNNNVEGDEEVCALLTSMRYINLSNKNLLLRTMKYGNNTVELYDIDTKKQSEPVLLFANRRNDEMNFYNCIDINPIDQDVFCLGGTDRLNKGILEVFKVPELTAIKDNKSNKKRKIDHRGLSSDVQFENLHKNAVEYCTWLNKEQLITSGDDFNINVLNVSSRNLFMTIGTNYKNATSLLGIGQDKFMAGFQDGSIKLYDIKTGNKSVAMFKDKKGYCDLVGDISYSNDRESHPNMFISSHYDSCNRLWDLRGGNTPIRSLTTSSEKNYAIKFNGNHTILSGGDDSSIDIFSI